MSVDISTRFRRWFLTKTGFLWFGYLLGGGGMSVILLLAFGPAGGIEWWSLLVMVGVLFGLVTSPIMWSVLKDDIRTAAEQLGIRDENND